MKRSAVCPVPGCPELTAGGLCEDHRRGRERQYRRARPKAYYNSPEWRVMRRAALERDGYRCRADGCDQPASDVDHVEPDGPDDDLSDLQSLCRSHHSRKTMRELRESGRLAGTTTDDAEPVPVPDRVARNMERKRVAREMLAAGASVEEITAATGLTPASIARWRRWGTPGARKTT